MKADKARKTVREAYARIARGEKCCCGPASDSASITGKQIGYTEPELAAVPEGANLGLGCGNPTALAALKDGEVVVDLGAGAGFDCFLAANRVGKAGRVIGVDMTPDMVEKARANAAKARYRNVEFRLGEIEHLPVPDAAADIIISNCVVNLVPDKLQVFREAYRVLKPGGRLMVSDIVLLKELPRKVRESVAAYAGCLAGAVLKPNYLAAIRAAGFRDVKVLQEARLQVESLANDPTAQALARQLRLKPAAAADVLASVVSVSVSGHKPGSRRRPSRSSR